MKGEIAVKFLDFLKRNKEKIVDILVLALIIVFLFSHFKPSLLFSKTTATGGDMGSHNYIAYYLKNYLLPQGNILGWTNDWYAGMPLLQFYFPLPYIAIVFLSYMVPIQIAFKLVTVLGIFSLPISAYFLAKWMDFKFPMPIIAAIFTLPFLFFEDYSIWGGNILSTLAGQFSHSISISISILFVGLLYKGIGDKKYILANSILFSLIILSHVFTTIFTLFYSFFFIFAREKKQALSNSIYMFKVYFLAFLLTAFWTLPFIFKLGFTSKLGWVPNKSLSLIYPHGLLPFLILAIISILFYFKHKEKRALYLLFPIILSIALFLLSPEGYLWNIRFLVPYYLFLCIASSYGASQLFERFKSKWILVFIIFIATILFVNYNAKQADDWIKWNYEGFENKFSQKTFFAINNFLKNLPPGRVLDEHSTKYNKFGTERAFENIPLFSGNPVIKGLLMDSASLTYFVFYMWSEVSSEPACPIAEAGCSTFNLETGTKHMGIFNIKYVLAITDQLKNELRANPSYIFLKKFDDIEIYEIKRDNKYVILPKFEPVLVKTNNWKKTSLKWFKNKDLLDVPLIFSKKADVNFKLITDDTLRNIEKIPITANCTITEKISNEDIVINTSCINKPLLIKIAYFPNWKVEGADRIYLASPAFMLVYPNKEIVKLHYGNTPSNIIGNALFYFGIFIVLFSLAKKNFSLKLSDKFFNYAVKNRQSQTGGMFLSFYQQAVFEHARKFSILQRYWLSAASYKLVENFRHFIKFRFLILFLLIFFFISISFIGNSNNPSSLYNKASKLFAKEKYEEAIPIYEKIVNISPDTKFAEDSQFHIAVSYLRMLAYEEALSQFEKLITDYKNSYWVPESYYNMGLIYIQLGEKNNAKKMFEAVIKGYKESRWFIPAKEELKKLE